MLVALHFHMSVQSTIDVRQLDPQTNSHPAEPFSKVAAVTGPGARGTDTVRTWSLNHF